MINVGLTSSNQAYISIKTKLVDTCSLSNWAGVFSYEWHFYVAIDPNEEGMAEAAVLTILSHCTIMYTRDMFDFKIFVGVLVIYKN